MIKIVYTKMRYPLDELIDKRSIIQLKIERIDSGEKDRLKNEYQDYTQAIEEYISERACKKEQVIDWHNRLYKANGNTWNLEAEIRKGQIGDLSLEEVGKTAIRIRESNGVRVRIKGEIVEKTGIGYKDIKINHASAEL
jgi:FtsZ-binding cell division protein ZapB